MQQNENEQLESLFRNLENHLLQPEVRRSPEALSHLLAEEFCEFGSSGRAYSRQEIIDHLRTASYVPLSISDFSVQMLAADVALARYRTAGSLRSSLWVYRDNRWQMLFHQGTKVSE